MSDRTTNTRAALHHLSITLAVTVFAVIAVIFLFVRRAAATVIPALAIPISLLATLIGMVLLGYTIDNLSLMALAISVGFVVDDAIVVVENVVRRLERGEPVLEATIAGTREVGFTILSITVSLVAVFIPVLFMAGVVGQFFREFGAVVSIAVIVSGLVSITLTPVLCAAMLRRHRSGGAFESSHSGWTIRLYGRSLGWVLRHQTADPPRVSGDHRWHDLALCLCAQGFPAAPGYWNDVRIHRRARRHLGRGDEVAHHGTHRDRPAGSGR